MDILWRVRLFDGPLLQDASGSEIRRFRSQRVGALLAYLALRLGRPCPREELCEALWPGEDLPITANRLRVTLASLRRQLEPSGVPFGAVLDVSESSRVRLRAETVWCDALALERALRAGRRDEAAQLSAGPLLPGFYDDWAIAERERFEVLCEGLGPQDGPADERPPEPPPRTATLRSGPPLPLYLTRFFGREAERALLAERLEESRLVTVLGPGGIGKTRLTVEVARELSVPLVFVSLVDLDDGHRVSDTVLRRLECVPAPGRDTVEQIVEALRRAGVWLLILDNAEHLLEPVAALTLTLLEALPELRMLVTSRRRLHITGETPLILSPLEPPPIPGRVGQLSEFPAVALFLDRARAVRPDFALTDRQVPALVEICQRLEGVPLALELAAARVSAQNPIQIAEALAHSLTSLRSSQRGLSERHRSLRAAVDGSLALLTAEQRRFFAALSVFRDGWTAAAAAAVTGVDDAQSVLDELVAGSLVTVRDDPHSRDVRFSFLETLRQVGAELLGEDEASAVRTAHARHFLKLAAAAIEGDVRTLEPLDGETENLLLALEWGWERRDERFWLGLGGWILYAFARGYHRLAAEWADRALPFVDTIDDHFVAGRVLQAVFALLADLGRVDDARSVAERLIDLSRRAGDPAGEVAGATFLGYLANNRGDFDEGVRIQRSALERARLLDDSALLQRCLFLTARALLGVAGNSVGVLGSREVEAATDADALAREALALMPDPSRLRCLAELTVALACGLLARRQEGYAYLKQAQRTSIEHQLTAVTMYTFFYECLVEQYFGRLERAAQLFGAFADRRERMGYHAFTAAYREQLRQSLVDALGADRFATFFYRGQQMSDREFVGERIPEDLLAEYNPEAAAAERLALPLHVQRSG